MRPRFSLLSLLFFSLACAAGMLLYRNSDAWEIERILPDSRDADVLQVSPNGECFRVSVNEKTEVWDRQGRRLCAPAVCGLQFSSDGRWLFSSPFSEDAKITAVDAHTGAIVNTFPHRGGFASNLTFSPEVRHLFAGGSISNSITVWDVSSGRILARTHLGGTGCFPPEEFLAARRASQERSTRDAAVAQDLIAWLNAAQGPRESNFENDPELEAQAMAVWEDADAQLTDDERRLYWFGYPYALRAYGLVADDGSCVLTWSHIDKQEPQPLRAVLWNGADLKRRAEFDLTGWQPCVLSPNADALLLTSEDNTTLRVLNLRNGKDLLRVNAPAGYQYDACPGLSETGLRFSADGTHIIEVLASEKNTLNRGVRVADGACVAQSPNSWSFKVITSDLKRVLDTDGTLRDATTDALLFNFSPLIDENLAVLAPETAGHERSVVALLPDGEHVVTQSSSEGVALWKRVRPEWWWGLFWFWETYLLLACCVALLWSLLRRPASRSVGAVAPGPAVPATARAT